MKKIPLTHGKSALVDDCDFEHLSRYKWLLQCGNYAARWDWRAGKWIFMHRLVANTPPGMQTDHINRDKLDNRRANLRVCTDLQNRMNKPKRKNAQVPYKGVTRHRNKFDATIWVKGCRVRLGRFTLAKDAARAYNEAALLYFKEFAFINKI